MTSVNAETARLVRATVTWVASEAWVDEIKASETLPCPAAASASVCEAVFWVCWTWSRALVMLLEKPAPLVGLTLVLDAIGCMGAMDEREEMGGIIIDLTSRRRCTPLLLGTKPWYWLDSRSG